MDSLRGGFGLVQHDQNVAKQISWFEAVAADSCCLEINLVAQPARQPKQTTTDAWTRRLVIMLRPPEAVYLFGSVTTISIKAPT